jgi:hypothetical protein
VEIYLICLRTVKRCKYETLYTPAGLSSVSVLKFQLQAVEVKWDAFLLYCVKGPFACLTYSAVSAHTPVVSSKDVLT